VSYRIEDVMYNYEAICTKASWGECFWPVRDGMQYILT